MNLHEFALMTQRLCSLVLFRKMLTKDKKPEEKGTDKESGQVIPTRPETPKLFKAALVVGKGETFSKLKETYKDSGATLQVLALSLLNMVHWWAGKTCFVYVYKFISDF